MVYEDTSRRNHTIILEPVASCQDAVQRFPSHQRSQIHHTLPPVLEEFGEVRHPEVHLPRRKNENMDKPSVNNH